MEQEEREIYRKMRKIRRNGHEKDKWKNKMKALSNLEIAEKTTKNLSTRNRNE